MAAGQHWNRPQGSSCNAILFFETLRRVTDALKDLCIPHAVLGGMAVVAHGYFRTTEGVDILIPPVALKTIHERLVGLGYRPVFEGSKILRDTMTGVKVEFVLSGQFPGDGKPKPVQFPDPTVASVERDGISYITLTHLIELKLASGMTNPGRLKDLADVQELIRVLNLKSDYAIQLDPFVREKYIELARAIEGETDSS